MFAATRPPMRITVDVDDELLRAVKVCSAKEGVTLQTAFEQALHAFLASRVGVSAGAPPIPVFGGHGARPGVDLTDSAALEAVMEGTADAGFPRTPTPQ